MAMFERNNVSLTEMEIRILIDRLRDKPSGWIIPVEDSATGSGMYYFYTEEDRLRIHTKLMSIES